MKWKKDLIIELNKNIRFVMTWVYNLTLVFPTSLTYTNLFRNVIIEVDQLVI